MCSFDPLDVIIPLQEKKGNYDRRLHRVAFCGIIPLQEKKGNYDKTPFFPVFLNIIPLQEKKGNYDGIYPHDHILFIIPLQEKIGKSYLDSLISVCAETSRAIINVVLIRSQHLLRWCRNGKGNT